MISFRCRFRGSALPALAVAAALLLASAARADVILFTNIGQAQGAPFGGTRVGVAIAVATSVLNVTSVEMVQSSGNLATESLTVYTQNPSDGKIGTVFFQDFTMSFNGTSGVETATANSPLVLQPNTSYWFAMNSNNPNFAVTLDAAANGSFTPTPYASFATPFAVTVTDSSGTGYGPASIGPPYVQLTGTAVPEPSSLALLGLAGIAGVLRGRWGMRI